MMFSVPLHAEAAAAALWLALQQALTALQSSSFVGFINLFYGNIVVY